MIYRHEEIVAKIAELITAAREAAIYVRSPAIVLFPDMRRASFLLNICALFLLSASEN